MNGEADAEARPVCPIGRYYDLMEAERLRRRAATRALEVARTDALVEARTLRDAALKACKSSQKAAEEAQRRLDAIEESTP